VYFKRKCEVCNGTGEVEMTEQEYLQTCNTEQLAYVLMKIFVTRTFCHLCPEGDVCDIGYKCKYSEGKKIEDWLEWLKQPHTVEE
jgi:DnaJ-class molecular chaperone